jgi:hypothetical protein
MACLAPPTPISFVAPANRPSYGTGNSLADSPDLHGREFKFLRQSMLEIQSRLEQRAVRFLVPAVENDEAAPYNSIPARRRYSVPAVFNHRGRGRPTSFDINTP